LIFSDNEGRLDDNLLSRMIIKVIYALNRHAHCHFLLFSTVLFSAQIGLENETFYKHGNDSRGRWMWRRMGTDM
jgi:hypothetical protein